MILYVYEGDQTSNHVKGRGETSTLYKGEKFKGFIGIELMNELFQLFICISSLITCIQYILV